MAKSRGISRKSELSPSVTQGSNRIDLGKNSDINLGQKSQPSTTSGGIGITQEVTSIGGTSVSAGIEIDLTPVDFGVRVDPSQNTISVSGGAEVPGGLIGISGGVEIDLGTGAITGGSIGAELGGLGINVSNSKKGGIGIEFTYQIPGTPIEISLGFGFPPGDEEPTPTPTPTPTPSPSPVNFDPIMPVGLDSDEVAYVLIGLKHISKSAWSGYPINCNSGFTTDHLKFDRQIEKNIKVEAVLGNTMNNVNTWWGTMPPAFETIATDTHNASDYTESMLPYDSYIGKANEKKEAIAKYKNRFGGRSKFGITSFTNYVIQPVGGNVKEFTVLEKTPYQTNITSYSVGECYLAFGRLSAIKAFIVQRNSLAAHTNNYNNPSAGCPGVYASGYNYKQLIVEDIIRKPATSPPPPPFPNPPPRKNNMDACCRDAILLGRANRRFLQELMIMFGRPLDAKGNLAPIVETTKFFGEPLERIKTPIENIADPEKEVIKFNNYYELQMYQLKQQINLDVGVDPQSFVAPTGKVQNPSYQRDSEQSLETNVQPDEDKAGNKRELQIGEDIKINSLAQQQQYLFEAVKRLEYLFPYGELADAKFEKSLIIPGATGVLQVHNLIHFKEFLVQFLNSTLGNPKIPVKVADTNALKEGNQEGTFNHFSISHMIRELYRVVLESGDDINALMETTIRDLRTNLANRIQIVQIAEMTQALVEDTGMLEEQVYIPVKLDGDPYAGKWKAGMGFQPDEDLDSKTEAATEKLMRATLKNFEAQVKVIRRDKRENADIRDLLLQLAEMFIRTTAIPATKEGIEKAVETARFKVRVENALTRSQYKRAAAAKLSRTKKKKKT
jgi:hypothetical protein